MPRIAGRLVADSAGVAGFDGPNLIIAVAVARAESGWNTTARALTSREDSRGLWQINVRAHPWGRSINLYNRTTNAVAARRVYREAGHSWHPWSVWLHCTHAQYIDDAIQAVRASHYRVGAQAEREAITLTAKHCQLPDIKVGEVPTRWTTEMINRVGLGQAWQGYIDIAAKGLHSRGSTIKGIDKQQQAFMRHHW